MFKRIYLFTFNQQEALQNVKKILSVMQIDCVDHPKDADLIMVFGGDGTMLHKAKVAHYYDIPIVGIHLGCRGFLADMESSDTESIERLVKGSAKLSHKQVLKCSVHNQVYYAINEVLVAKESAIRMIHYRVTVDEEDLYEQTADGVILSTTTGSSAYALSAGGPILHPKSKSLALVPIASNRITSMPMVLHETAKINIKTKSWKDSRSVVAVDSVVVAAASDTHSVDIELDPRPLKLLHPLEYNYYNVLKKKRGWEVTPSYNLD